MRPKPVASPPAGNNRLTPLLHFRFSHADFTLTPSGSTIIHNHGSLGARGDGNISATCTGPDTGFVSAGRQGGGFVFDGETCHVRVPDPVSPVGGNHWTIMFWIKRKSVAAGQLVMLRGNDNATWTPGKTQIKFSKDPPPADETADELVRAAFFVFVFLGRGGYFFMGGWAWVRVFSLFGLCACEPTHFHFCFVVL
jgi:hypothetical protein